MPYVNEGTLTTDKREIAISETWDTQTDWDAYQSINNCVITNGVVMLQESQFPTNGLVHRYDATQISGVSDGGTVSTWSDTEGTADLSATGAPVLETNGIGGNQSVITDGSDDYLDGQFGSAIGTPRQVVVVAQALEDLGTDFSSLIDSFSDAQNIIGSDAGNWRLFAGTSLDDGVDDQNPHIFNALVNGTSSDFRIDGASAVSGDAGTLSLDGLTIGARGGQSAFYNAQFGEVLVYNRELTSTEESDLETYLSDKWGITI